MKEFIFFYILLFIFMRFTLKKYEHLTSKRQIESLFVSGKSHFTYPVKMIYHITDVDDKGVKVLFSVSKKIFKKATDRNLLKRRMREAYRKNKPSVKTNTHAVSVGFIYTEREITEYLLIEKAMISHIKRLSSLFNKK